MYLTLDRDWKLGRVLLEEALHVSLLCGLRVTWLRRAWGGGMI